MGDGGPTREHSGNKFLLHIVSKSPNPISSLSRVVTRGSDSIFAKMRKRVRLLERPRRKYDPGVYSDCRGNDRVCGRRTTMLVCVEIRTHRGTVVWKTSNTGKADDD